MIRAHHRWDFNQLLMKNMMQKISRTILNNTILPQIDKGIQIVRFKCHMNQVAMNQKKCTRNHIQQSYKCDVEQVNFDKEYEWEEILNFLVTIMMKTNILSS